MSSRTSQKKKEKTKPEPKETDPNQLSDPGKPTADTIDLVSVIAIDCGAYDGGKLACLCLESGEEFYV